jgi:hypothetical protein
VTSLIQRQSDLDSHVQRDDAGGAGLKVPLTAIEWKLPVKATTLECGIVLEPALVLKGDFAVLPAKGGDVTLSGGAGPIKFKGGGADSASLFKAEVQARLGDAGAKVKGTLDANPAGVNPAVEFSGPLGVAGLDLRLEFAPWKFKYDFAGKESVKLLPLTAGVKREGQFDTATFRFKGSIGVDCEASLDPVGAFKYLSELYGPRAEAEALTLGAAEVSIVGMVVAGALLAGFDYIDQARRARLIAEVTARGLAIVQAEATYMTVLEGRKVTPVTKEENRAASEAARVRAALAAKVNMDDDTLTCVTRPQEGVFAPFRWRDLELNELEKHVLGGLDAWATDKPVFSLWGLRVVQDKRNVTARIEGIRDNPSNYKV